MRDLADFDILSLPGSHGSGPGHWQTHWVSFERAQAFASAWGSRFVDVGNLGHIGSAAKLGLWPQRLVWLGQFTASIS